MCGVVLSSLGPLTRMLGRGLLVDFCSLREMDVEETVVDEAAAMEEVEDGLL